MLVIPAVDIRHGRAVRLVQGRADEETVYDRDPLRAAERWAKAGAKRIHLVDLDGAFAGRPVNAAVARKLLRALGAGHEIEIGGGLRTSEAVAEYLAAGAARCILGTKAVEDRRFLEELASAHPGRISLGLDAKDGQMATKGWIEIRDIKAVDLVRGLAGLPLGEVIYTDIERDGMLEGPNWARLEEMRAASPFPLIASGGVTTVEDLRRLRRLGCFGAIVGKALYDGRLEISQALAEQEESQGPAE